VPDDVGQLVVLRSPALGPISHTVAALDALVWVLPPFTLVVLASSLLLTHDRRRTVVGLGLGAALVFLLARLAIQQLEVAMVASVADPAARAAAAVILGAVLRDLLGACALLSIVGAAVAVAALLVGRVGRGLAPSPLRAHWPEADHADAARTQRRTGPPNGVAD
jgi:hypothetical protein